MKKFITFGGPTERFHDNVKRLCNEAKELDYFDEIKGFTEQDIMKDTDFWNKHKDFIQSNKRGYGYWVWKPYLISKELENMQENDILLYLDAGCQLNKYAKTRFFEYIDALNNDINNYGIVSFKTPHREVEWTKKEVFDYFSFWENKNIKDTENQHQCMSGVILMRKTDHSCSLMRLWKNLNEKYSLVNDIISNEECNGFMENRHDQSIYSMLVYKFGSVKFNDETSYFADNNINPYPFVARRLTH